MAKTIPLKERIENLILERDGCWDFTGRITYQGYGQMTVGSRTDNSRRNRQAHIVSYEAFVGPIPDGLVLDHLCRNRKCVNPKHLEPVTVQENIRRGEVGKRESGKTHCPQGHEYSGDNLVIRTYQGKTKMITERQCRTCIRKRNRKAFLVRREERIA